MYWLVVVGAAIAWMIATRRDEPQPVAAIRHPSPRVTSAERWRAATATQRMALIAMVFGRVVWIGLLLVAVVVMIIGTATWMY